MAVGFVLLIACVNVANLLIARATARSKELTIRAALGASRVRLVRQLTTESILLASMGGLTGLLLARWSFEGLVRFVPNLNSLGGPALDWRVLGFCLALSTLSGVLFGTLPALKVTGGNIGQAVRETGRMSAGLESRRLRNALAVIEIGVSFVLLVGAGLLLRSFDKLLHVDPGFQAEQVLTMKLNVPDGPDILPAESRALCKRILERVEVLPGVLHAGIGGYGLAVGISTRTTTLAEGATDPGRGRYPSIRVYAVTSGYFRAMGIPHLKGRLFEDRDGFLPSLTRDKLRAWFQRADNLPVVISQATAARFWPNEDPIGRRLRYAPDSGGPWLQVVGVVGDLRDDDLTREPTPAMYLYAYHRPTGDMLVVRAIGNPASIASAVRREVQAVDPNLPVTDIRSVADVISQSLGARRDNVMLIGSLAALALVLAMVGVYGVMAYSVASRTQEFGVHIALGASRADVLMMVLRNGCVLTAAGIAVGIAAALGLTRLLAGMLYGVAPTDALTFGGAVGLLAAAALLACYFPARRATHVDPVKALRNE